MQPTKGKISIVAVFDKTIPLFDDSRQLFLGQMCLSVSIDQLLAAVESIKLAFRTLRSKPSCKAQGREEKLSPASCWRFCAENCVFQSLWTLLILFPGFPRDTVGRRHYSAADMQNESEIGFLVVMLLFSTCRSFYIWLISGDVLKVYNPWSFLRWLSHAAMCRMTAEHSWCKLFDSHHHGPYFFVRKILKINCD